MANDSSSDREWLNSCYFSGVGNKVVCFCCGVAIIDWESTADPWVQHALVSPQCHFIKHEKGEDFIQQMAAREVSAFWLLVVL